MSIYLFWSCVYSITEYFVHKKTNAIHPYLMSLSLFRVLSVDSSDEVEAFYLERIQMLRETFGVLLFLYSVMYTKVNISCLLNLYIVTVQWQPTSYFMHRIRSCITLSCGKLLNGAKISTFTIIVNKIDFIPLICVMENSGLTGDWI